MTASADGRSSRVIGRMVDLALRPARSRGAVVLAFHQIDAAKFAGWIRLLTDHFELVSLDELARRREEGQSLSGLLAVTFDDGWADACEPVAQLCVQNEWPVMIYLVSGALENGTSLWFAELPELLDAARGRRIEAAGHVLDLSTRWRSRRSAGDLVRKLKQLSGNEALEVVRSLRIAAGIATGGPRAPFVGVNFTARYRDSEWVSFGSHTVDHQAIAVQDDSAVDAQCCRSKAALEALLARPVRHFAYPYGAPHDVGVAAPSIVRRYYDTAVTMVRGVCGSSADGAALPRIPLYDRDGRFRMIAKIALAPWI